MPDVKMIRIQSSFAVFWCSGAKLESYYGGDVVIASVRLPSYSLSGDYQFSADTPATINRRQPARRRTIRLEIR